MTSANTRLSWAIYTAVTLAAFAGCVALLVFYTPTEATMGPVQKIFYVHLPIAINAFLACLVVFIGSIGYLWQRKTVWDDLAAAAAKVAVILCTGVLITGMIWGRSAWGQWWTWSPRLTFSLMLWLLYVVYLMVRASIESPQRRALVCAVYGLTAFLDVPLVWLSAKLIPEIHPSSVALEPAMKLTLGVWFVPVTLAAAGLIAGRFALNRIARETETAPAEAPALPGRMRITGGVI
jgi:heme exporter protein C